MGRRMKTTLAIIAILILTIISAVYFYRLGKNADDNALEKNSQPTMAGNDIRGTLGTYRCFSKFGVERGGGISDQPIDLDLARSELQLESFKSFASGAFSGKIKNYQPETNKKFPGLIDDLMKELQIRTFEHLKANICLYNRDFLNPPNGAVINYYIEHYFCTNSCQWGHYELRVDLGEDGSFVGYRHN